VKKIKKSKTTKREKIFFIVTLISVIIAIGAIVHAGTATQGHPASEITYSNIPCSNICNDDDKDGDTSSSNELQTLSSVLSRGNSASGYQIDYLGGVGFSDTNNDGKRFGILEAPSFGDDFPGRLVVHNNNGDSVVGISQNGDLEISGKIKIDGTFANLKIETSTYGGNDPDGSGVCSGSDPYPEQVEASCNSGTLLVGGGCSCPAPRTVSLTYPSVSGGSQKWVCRCECDGKCCHDPPKAYAICLDIV